MGEFVVTVTRTVEESYFVKGDGIGTVDDALDALVDYEGGINRPEVSELEEDRAILETEGLVKVYDKYGNEYEKELW